MPSPMSALAVLVCLAILNLALATTSSAVQILTSENFENTINNVDEKSPSSLIFFYAPWCGHCNKFHPVYDELAIPLTKGGHVVAKVDAIEQTELAERYNVNSFPALFAMRSTSKYTRYTGANKKEEVLDFMDRQARPSVEKVDASNLGEFLKVSKLSVLLRADTDDRYLNAFSKLAETFGDSLVADSPYFGLWVGEKEKLPANLIQVTAINPEIYQSKVTEFNLLSSNIKDDDILPSIKNFVVGSSLSSESVIATAPNFIRYMPGLVARSQSGSTLNKFLVVIDRQHVDSTWNSYGESKEIDRLGTIANAVGEDFLPRGVANLWVDPVENSAFLERYNLPKNEYPIVLLLDASGKSGSLVTKQVVLGTSAGKDDGFIVTQDSLRDLYENCFFDGKSACAAKPKAASDKALKKYMLERPIKRLVGKTLNSKILVDSDEIDQFVFFQSGLEPREEISRDVYSQFANRFMMEPTLDFFYLDVTKNDVPMKSVEIASTPAVYFFPSNDKENPILFRGNVFDVEPLRAFMRLHLTIPFKSYMDEEQYGGFAVLIKYHWRKFLKMGPFSYLKDFVFAKKFDIDAEHAAKRDAEEKAKTAKKAKMREYDETKAADL